MGPNGYDCRDDWWFSSLVEQPLIVDLVGVDVETVMGVVGQFKCLCFYF